MRNLIKKILKEEINNNSIEVITYDFNQIKHFFSINEGVANAPIYSEDVNLINNKIKRMYNAGDSLKVGNYKILIEPSKHWLQRLNRKMEDEYKNDESIEDPELFEGLDLIEKNMEKIIYPYMKNINWEKKPRPCMELINHNAILPNGDITTYSIVLSIEKLNKGLFNIKLLTQIKGERLYSQNYNCSKIKLYENKKRINKYCHPFY
jgi:hypothetical protein